MSTVPVDASLFASLDPPVLAGSRCAACGTTTFPAAGCCPRCCGTAMNPTPLPERGTVWSWTVQRFAPKPPYTGHAPFTVGYVDLGDVIVESRLLADAPRIGMAVRLVLEPVTGGAVTYAFAPEEAP